MNTTDDLTTMLRERAAAVPSADIQTRIGAVRGRVRAVRRRRTATVAVAVVAALAGVVGLQALPQQRKVPPADAPSKLVGRDVPKTIERLGATYTYVRGYEAKDGNLTVTVPASADPMVMRVASQTKAGSIKVEAVGGEWIDSRLDLPAGDFGYQFDSTGVRTDYRISSSQPVALALYRLSKPPAGIASGGITFPRHVGGAVLEGAKMGEPGADSVTFTIPGDATRLMASSVCRGTVPKSDGVMVEVDGRMITISGGCETDPSTVFADGGAIFDVAKSARKRTVTVRLVDSQKRPLPVPGGTRIGAAVYGTPPPQFGLESSLAHDGHDWVMHDGYAVKGGPRGVSTTIDTSEEPVLVMWQTTAPGSAQGVARVFVDGKQVASSTVGGASWFRLSTGGRAQVSVRVPAGAGATGSLVVPYGVYDDFNAG